ncbi:Protein of uncharacterised function DUF45 [Mycoplasmopsis citelli]|uniref:Protein of uncharacterized function DUF45 n=1 Tax=Mycoplasmopsis citelli TaxID=171281 RepID=A0A449B2E9_9BACT|nr:YgjP-like metallopeptidase domain-containing protein [Mycoplasmopsis citelli]VEU74725.1 Protein of uncharacterised function DUF45 [Mycoplasmopsis citelli]
MQDHQQRSFNYSGLKINYFYIVSSKRLSIQVLIKNNTLFLYAPIVSDIKIEEKLLYKIAPKYLKLLKLCFDVNKNYFYFLGSKISWKITITKFLCYISLYKNDFDELIKVINLSTKSYYLSKNKKDQFNLLIIKKVEKWIKESLEIEILKHQQEIAAMLNTFSPPIKIKKINYAWGINYRKGQNINYNLNLYIFNVESLKQIIAHELIHNFVSKHSKNFYQYMFVYNSNYKEINQKINNYDFI